MNKTEVFVLILILVVAVIGVYVLYKGPGQAYQIGCPWCTPPGQDWPEMPTIRPQAPAPVTPSQPGTVITTPPAPSSVTITAPTQFTSVASAMSSLAKQYGTSIYGVVEGNSVLLTLPVDKQCSTALSTSLGTVKQQYESGKILLARPGDPGYDKISKATALGLKVEIWYNEDGTVAVVSAWK